MTTPTGPLRTLLVTRDGTLIEQIERICRERPELTLVGVAARLDEAASLAHQRRAHVLLIDTALLSQVETDLMNVALAAPDCYIFVLVPPGDWETAQRALLAGARGFLSKPPHAEECVQTITRAITLDLLRHSEGGQEESQPPQGRVITVVGAKGGIGRTFLATNLGVALHAVSGKTVLLAEAMSLPGDMSALLSMLPKVALPDVMPLVEDMNLPAILETLDTYREGLYILPGVLEYGSAAATPDQFAMCLRLCRQGVDFVVLDTDELQDPLTEVALREADVVLLVLTPDLLVLYRTSRFLPALIEHAGVPEDRIRLVLNMVGLRGGVRRETLERVIGRPFHHEVPLDIDIVREALHQGEPVVLAARRSPISQHIYALANDLLQQDQPQPPAKTDAPVPVLQGLRALWDGLRPGAFMSGRAH